MANAPLNLQWDKILPDKNDDPPAELEVVDGNSHKDLFDDLSDHQLDEKIQRMQSVALGSKLPDGGAKLKAKLARLEAERERRKLRRVQKDAEVLEKPTQSQNSILSDATHDFRSKTTPAQSYSQLSFGCLFSGRLGNKSGTSVKNAFAEELACVGRSNPNSWRPDESTAQKKRLGTRMSSRPMPFQSPRSLFVDKDMHGSFNDIPKGIASCSYSTSHLAGNLSGHCSEKRRAIPRAIPCESSRGPDSSKVTVLLDEEDSQPIQPTHEADKSKGIINAKIYYPSRSDPKAVELCHSDMECLDPGSPLSSPIMNFYIEYLQRPQTGRPGANYHFFNTYFYKKLEEAVSYKKSDKDTFYRKFRRWWKGVNIFQKAYIFLPIHADQHWSLVIICIPAREEESGPIILHLDSLGFHNSRSIFSYIEGYLKEEWNYLNQCGAPLDVPISEKIWRKLSRRIDRKIIKVPQQKNDYDCGLFVLFFMERFIEEAPGRLRKDDLHMFGSKWFLPEEASRLRARIRNLLQEQFERSRLENGGGMEAPASLSDSSEGSDLGGNE